MVSTPFQNEYRPATSEYIKTVRAYHDIVAAESDNRGGNHPWQNPRQPHSPAEAFSKERRLGAAGAASLVAPTGCQTSRDCCRNQEARAPIPCRPAPRSEPPKTSVPRASEDIQIVERPGADYMVDVFKSLGFEYLFATPGSSFRGIHESVINHGGNSNPEFITFMHEECSVAAANGYAKIEGKPALVCAHGTVGIQHAAMAIYNAYCDQAPVFIVAGNISDAAERRGRVEWLHAAQDVAATVRDYTKWDDNPGFSDALRRIGRARLPDRHDRAHDARGAGRRRRSAGRGSAQGIRLAHSEAPEDLRSRRAIPRRWPNWRRCWCRRKIR